MPAYKYTTKSGAVRWYASFWYQDWTGERKKKKKEGFLKRSDALDYEREFLRRKQKRCDMSFASLVELYRADIPNRVRVSTTETADSIIDKWALPYFGKLPVDQIDAAAIRQWQNTLMGLVNPRSGKPYSQTYLRTINSRVSSIFNYAVKYYHLPQNPCLPAGSMGKKKRDKVSFWTLEQFNQAMVYVTKPGYRLALLMLYWLGIRIGELLAATPADFVAAPVPTFVVEKTYHRRHGEDLAGPPKEENSERRVTMPAFLYDEAMAYIRALYDIQPGDRVFYFTKGTLNKELDRVAAAAGLQRIRIHDLRHSHAALLVELGYSMPAIAERLGDTVEVVMETYVHLYPNKLTEMAADLDKQAVQNGVPGKDILSALLPPDGNKNG